MTKNYFELIRPGINTTFQDEGRKNLYHIGITFSGAMDKRNYLIANKLVGNNLNAPAVEFAYQGPLLKYTGYEINFVITGDVSFILRSKGKEIDGNCYEVYNLKNNDEIDILSTNKSVYGYFNISGEFKLKPQWNSYSINTKAKIGPNNGKKFEKNQKIFISKIFSDLNKKKIEYINTKIENIRIIKGTNFHYFSEEGKKNFLWKTFYCLQII